MDKSSNLPAEAKFFEQFTSHPASVGETYWSHMAFAFRFSARLMGAGLAALIHGLIPPLFCTTGSDMIRKMHKEITERHG
ncbi:MAG: DUF6356 family protein [Pseudomonadota bacterium]